MKDESSFVLDNVRYILELRQNLISLGTLEKEGFTVKMQSGKIKVIKGSLVVLSGTRRANYVYTLDGQAVTRKTLKGSNVSWEFKKTFMGYGVGSGSMQVLQGVGIEACTNSGFDILSSKHVIGGNTQAWVIWMLGQMCMCSATVARNAVTTAMAITRSIHQAEIWATKGLLDKAKGNILGMKIVKDQSGNTLGVSQSRFYNRKLVQTLLEGHSILSLEGSLSGDCDVEKNGK
ncbi:hypothetical protein Tco_1486230 [Tanacetum coccineum]